MTPDAGRSGHLLLGAWGSAKDPDKQQLAFGIIVSKLMKRVVARGQRHR